MSISTILHPTDFSSNSATAYKLACALARYQAKPLVLLHVLEPPRPEENGVAGGLGLLRRQDARVLLNRMRLQARDVWIETLVTRGEPASTIVSLAQDFECSLIVMGMQGNSQSASGKGRVADQVSRRAGCRVLCIQSLPDRETAPDGRNGHGQRPIPR